MKDNVKVFEIRWGDLDPNRHVANSAYCEFMNDTRMTYLNRNGFTQKDFAQLNFGPVVFREEYHYLKEVMPGETVYVDVELLGHTEDEKFYRFCHSLFKPDGNIAVYSELTFGWMDLKERKLITPPERLRQILLGMPRSPRFGILPKEDLRDAKVPVGKRLEITT